MPNHEDLRVAANTRRVTFVFLAATATVLIGMALFVPDALAYSDQTWYPAYNMSGVTPTERQIVANLTSTIPASGQSCAAVTGGTRTGPTLTAGRSYILAVAGSGTGSLLLVDEVTSQGWLHLDNVWTTAGGFHNQREDDGSGTGFRATLLYSEKNDSNKMLIFKISPTATRLITPVCASTEGGFWTSYPGGNLVGVLSTTTAAGALGLVYADNATGSDLPDYYSLYHRGDTCSPCLSYAAQATTSSLSVTPGRYVVVTGLQTNAGGGLERLQVRDQNNELVAQFPLKVTDTMNSSAGANASCSRVTHGASYGGRHWVCAFNATATTTSVSLRVNDTSVRFVPCNAWTLPGGRTCANSTTDMTRVAGGFTSGGHVVAWLFNTVDLPPTPSGVTAIALSQTSINVSWTLLPDVMNYQVNQTYPDPPGASVGFPVTNYLVVTGLRPGITHCFVVAANNSAGQSAFSPEACAKTHRPFRQLTGDNGTLYGGDKASLANDIGISAIALDIFFGLIIVLGLAAMGWGVFGGLGAGIGAVAGVFIAGGLGFFPLWLVFLLVVVPAAVFALTGRRGVGV